MYIVVNARFESVENKRLNLKMASNTKSTKNYYRMQKSVIRNPENNPCHTNAQVFSEDQLLSEAYQQFKQKQQQNCHAQQQGPYPQIVEANKSVFCIPQKNSSEKVAKEIEQLEVKARQLQINVEDNPQTKELIAQKVTKILNFRPDQVVFKNLISLNVNDSVLLPKTRPNLGKKYERSENNRIPVPDLADFLDPLPPLEVPVVDCAWEPEHISPQYDCFAAYQDYYGTHHPLC